MRLTLCLPEPIVFTHRARYNMNIALWQCFYRLYDSILTRSVAETLLAQIHEICLTFRLETFGAAAEYGQ